MTDVLRAQADTALAEERAAHRKTTAQRDAAKEVADRLAMALREVLAMWTPHRDPHALNRWRAALAEHSARLPSAADTPADPLVFDPNDDIGARYIAYTYPGGDALTVRPVVGWGADGEGWPHLTPVVAGAFTPEPETLAFDPARIFTYGATRPDAAWNLAKRLSDGSEETLIAAILDADWDTVRRFAADPGNGDLSDVAHGALAGAGEPAPPRTSGRAARVVPDAEDGGPR